VAPDIADFRLPIKTIASRPIENQNRKSAILEPTRYREVVHDAPIEH
jgi:hypothetical protein